MPNIRLSPGRKIVLELLHHARAVPSIPVARELQVGALLDHRGRLPQRPSWTAIFMRAYGLVARQFPELRRAYIPWPYAHLYEHPQSICALVVEREWQGEQVLLGAKIVSPEELSIPVIHEHLRRFKQTPVWEVSAFRQILRLGRLPWLLRRFVFWQTLYLSGYKRAKRFGTFMLSSYGSLGAEQLHPLSCLTTLLTFGPISSAGEVAVKEVAVKIVYDHRVMDGRCVARCLSELERVMNTELAAELRGLGRKAA